MVFGHLVEVDGQAAAGALWFRNFSTWDGVAGIYLEDLFVRPQFRRRGLARTLLATLARECVDNGYSRLTWAVLDWNVNAIALYDASVGGRRASGSPTGCRDPSSPSWRPRRRPESATAAPAAEQQRQHGDRHPATSTA